MSRSPSPVAHVAIDVQSRSSSAPSQRHATYPPHLESPRNASVDWELSPPQQPLTSTRSSPGLRSHSKSHPASSHHSSPTLNGSSCDDDDDDLVAWDASSIRRGKQRAEEAYGEVEGAIVDAQDGSPMLRGGGTFESKEPRRSPKGQRVETVKAQRRRRLILYGSVVGLGLLLLAAGRHRMPEDWKFQRWKYGASAEVFGSGGNGSLVTTEDGSQFTYINSFGGVWNSTPFATSARPQSWTPALSEPWDYSNRRIYGVNIGGWLVLEPFIAPSLFEPFIDTDKPAVDEWTLCENLGSRLAEVVEHHYATFIIERDFAEIAAAGLAWVRIPLGYYAIEVAEGEPFLAQVSWKYFLKAIKWARKYGLRINLDLHAVPGSQNGWNHSGRTGTIGFMNGVMGVANAQRTLNHIRALAEFISRPENAEVVQAFSILNEPYMPAMSPIALKSFYLEAYKTIREASGLGEGKGPFIILHDGFKGTGRWHDWLKGSDRVALDSHRYLAFRPANLDDMGAQSLKPCANWAREFNRTMSRVGLAMTGEWSVAVNDCGRFLNGAGLGNRYEGTFPTPQESWSAGVAPVGACEKWENFLDWDDELKKGLNDMALAHMDSFQNWYYWTWKTGPSPRHPDRPANAAWSYSLGLKHGWIPEDPRTAQGFCDANTAARQAPPFKHARLDRPLQDWQVGRAPPDKLGVLSLAKAVEEGWSNFPTEWIGKDENRKKTDDLPRWERGAPGEGALLLDGPRPTEPEPLEISEKGWWRPMPGCSYRSPWDGEGVQVPDGACVGPVAHQ